MSTGKQRAGDTKKPLRNPQVSTIKRLYAVAGNECAFPGCKLPLVDVTAGVVTSKVCHIKARSPGGPRHDVTQTAEERHGYDNLLLLCGGHHDVIDQDDGSFSVEDLARMKQAHELKQVASAIPEDIDEAAAMLYADTVMTMNAVHNLGNSVVNGSIINAPGQMGGQAAHMIVNEAAPPRAISQATAESLVQHLRRYSGRHMTFTCVWGDEEAFRFTASLMQLFQRAGWVCEGVNRAMFTGPVAPLMLVVHPAGRSDNTFYQLVDWFKAAGLPMHASANETYTGPAIIAGTNM